MALELIHQPDDFSFARNPIYLDLATDDRIATEGTLYARTVTFSSGAVTGNTVDITFNGIQVQMDAQVAPITEDGLHFRTQGADSLATWISNFAEDLRSNYYIAKNYTFIVGATSLIFIAREKGAEYAITFTSMPGSYTLGSATAGLAEAEQSRFKVIAEVHSDLLSDPITVELYKVADSYTGGYDGHFRVRLEEILYRLCSAPAPDGDFIQSFNLVNKQLVSYYLRYFEVYGTTPEAKYYYLNDNSEANFYAFIGGLDKKVWPDHTFFTDYASEVQFLTWLPRELNVTEHQPLYLYWLYITSGTLTTGNIYVRIYYTDGTSTNHSTLAFDTDGGTNYQTLYFPIGYYQVIEALKTSGKTVDYWTAEIKEGESGITKSEVYRFNLVANKPTHANYFLYRNSLGGYDTLRATGEHVQAIDITGDVLSTWLDADYAVSEGENTSGEVDAVNRFTYNTGLMGKKEMLQVLQELLATQTIYKAERVGSTTVTKITPLAMIRDNVRVLSDYLEADGFYLQFQVVDGHEYIGHSEIVS